jgi:hypothetical protein
MPDGFCVVRFAALDQLRNLSPERIGNRSAVAANGVSIANTFGLAVRAVREADGERDPVESCVDRLDKRDLISALI